MARGVLTATATVGQPLLVLADEPTPGLHPAVVAETLARLRAMADDGAAVVLITHDLLGALEVADTVAVFYAGTTVEVAPAHRFSGRGRVSVTPTPGPCGRRCPATASPRWPVPSRRRPTSRPAASSLPAVPTAPRTARGLGPRLGPSTTHW